MAGQRFQNIAEVKAAVSQFFHNCLMQFFADDSLSRARVTVFAAADPNNVKTTLVYIHT